MSDLDIFFPQPREVILREHRLKLSPMRVAQTSVFLHHIGPAMSLMRQGAFAAAIAEQFSGLAEAVAVASGLSRAEVEALYNDEFLQLLVAVVEVNLSFFLQAGAPHLTALSDLVVVRRQAPATDGPSSSPASSAPATA